MCTSSGFREPRQDEHAEPISFEVSVMFYGSGCDESNGRNGALDKEPPRADKS